MKKPRVFTAHWSGYVTVGSVKRDLYAFAVKSTPMSLPMRVVEIPLSKRLSDQRKVRLHRYAWTDIDNPWHVCHGHRGGRPTDFEHADALLLGEEKP